MSDHEPPGLVAELLAEAAAQGVSVGDAYEITTIIPYSEEDPEVKHYTMPPQDLDQFFHDYTETAEVVVDIRPAGGG